MQRPLVGRSQATHGDLAVAVELLPFSAGLVVKNPLRMLEKCDGKMGYLRVLLMSERRATAAGTKVSSDLVKSGVADIKDRVLLRKVCQVCT
jgi:hypothetical protein